MPLPRSRCCISSLTAAAIVAACSGATTPRAPSAVVTVQRDTLVASMVMAGTVRWMNVTVPLSIYNAGTERLTFEYCASGIEGRVAGDWQRAWGPICAVASGSPAEILPGETRELTVTVTAAVEGPGGPEWQLERIDGMYRFAAGLVRSGMSGAIPVVHSNAFTLVSGS
jgi:hypothetical protein